MSIEKRPMTIEDFLQMLAANAQTYPEFASLPEDKKRYLAWVNINTGVAESYWDGDQLVGVGGIRFVGIGEGWLITTPHIRNERKFFLLRTAKKAFEHIRDSKNLWRVFATSRISTNFLRHLSFKPEPEVHVWMRTIEDEETIQSV